MESKIRQELVNVTATQLRKWMVGLYTEVDVVDSVLFKKSHM